MLHVSIRKGPSSGYQNEAIPDKTKLVPCQSRFWTKSDSSTQLVYRNVSFHRERPLFNGKQRGRKALNRPIYHRRRYVCVSSFNSFNYCFYKKNIPVMQHDKNTVKLNFSFRQGNYLFALIFLYNV
jgi:hypothetical protein